MRTAVLVGAWLLACSNGAAVTLEDYARGKVLPVYTVGVDTNIPLTGRDQSNNYATRASKPARNYRKR